MLNYSINTMVNEHTIQIDNIRELINNNIYSQFACTKNFTSVNRKIWINVRHSSPLRLSLIFLRSYVVTCIFHKCLTEGVYKFSDDTINILKLISCDVVYFLKTLEANFCTTLSFFYFEDCIQLQEQIIKIFRRVR